MGDSANAIKNLPLSLIAKLDSLANVEFHKLTKKILKDRIEEIKIAVAKELAKRSSSSNANGDSREHVPSRPQLAAETDETLNNTQFNAKKARVNEKVVDKGVPLSRSNASTSAKSSSVGLKKCPPRPSFNDLIKFADKPREHNRQSPERSVPQRSLSPPPQKSESASRASSSHFSRPLSPVNRGRSKADALPAKSNGIPRLGNLKQPTSSTSSSRQYNASNRPIHSEDARYNSRNDSRVNNVPRDDHRAQRDDLKGQRVADKDEKLPKSNKKEPSKSARVKRKDEELRILEEKKRRLREEEERIRLRDQVLAGQVHRTNDLKTLVTKSHGSTLLSCGSGGAGTYDNTSPPYSHNERQSDSRGRDLRGARDNSIERRNGSMSARLKDPRSMQDRREAARDRHDDRNRREERSMNARREPARSRPMHINPYMDDAVYSRSNFSRSRFDDYDEEEDEEMDDFIDDDVDGAESTDVTSYIKEIFGYDKRRYADFDDDDIQEASYADIEKEEKRSARLGAQEDAEAERLEREHQKLKRQRMMASRR